MVEEIWLEIVVSNVSDSKTAWYEIKGSDAPKIDIYNSNSI